eukprot:5127988-Alexandrium_andersonii.AAC.1
MLPRAPDWAGPRAEALFKMCGTHTRVVRFQASARNPHVSHPGGNRAGNQQQGQNQTKLGRSHNAP